MALSSRRSRSVHRRDSGIVILITFKHKSRQEARPLIYNRTLHLYISIGVCIVWHELVPSTAATNVEAKTELTFRRKRKGRS